MKNARVYFRSLYSGDGFDVEHFWYLITKVSATKPNRYILQGMFSCWKSTIKMSKGILNKLFLILIRKQGSFSLAETLI